MRDGALCVGVTTFGGELVSIAVVTFSVGRISTLFESNRRSTVNSFISSPSEAFMESLVTLLEFCGKRIFFYWFVRKISKGNNKPCDITQLNSEVIH